MRKVLYTLLKYLNDINAIKRGKAGRRIGRRAAGKSAGRLFRRIFK